MSYQSWVKAGEPNPFVSRSYARRPQTRRNDFTDIFADDLAKPIRRRT